MIPQSNRNLKSGQKQIISLINSVMVGTEDVNMASAYKKKRKGLTEVQEALIKKLDEKSKALFGMIGDENTEYQGAW